MNGKENAKSENLGKGALNSGDQENVVKITVTKDAADQLAELVSKINEGFFAGRVHRQDVASWIVSRFWETHTDSELHHIREQHYDDSTMLEAQYKQMRETGKVPDFLRDALRKQFSSVADAPKRSKKQLTKEYINDVLSNNEEAV